MESERGDAASSASSLSSGSSPLHSQRGGREVGDSRSPSDRPARRELAEFRDAVREVLAASALGTSVQLVGSTSDDFVLYGGVDNRLEVRLGADPLTATILVTVGGMTSSGGRHRPVDALALLGALAAAIVEASEADSAGVRSPGQLSNQVHAARSTGS